MLRALSKLGIAHVGDGIERLWYRLPGASSFVDRPAFEHAGLHVGHVRAARLLLGSLCGLCLLPRAILPSGLRHLPPARRGSGIGRFGRAPARLLVMGDHVELAPVKLLAGQTRINPLSGKLGELLISHPLISWSKISLPR